MDKRLAWVKSGGEGIGLGFELLLLALLPPLAMLLCMAGWGMLLFPRVLFGGACLRLCVCVWFVACGRVAWAI